MKDDEPKCTIKAPLCVACRLAAGLKRGPVSIHDMDPKALQWRAEAVEAVKQLRKARAER